jgi:hypothetical protein
MHDGVVASVPTIARCKSRYRVEKLFSRTRRKRLGRNATNDSSPYCGSSVGETSRTMVTAAPSAKAAWRALPPRKRRETARARPDNRRCAAVSIEDRLNLVEERLARPVAIVIINFVAMQLNEALLTMLAARFSA